MSKLLVSALFLISLILTACGPTVIHQEEVSLPDSGWNYDAVPRFDFTIQDTTLSYDLLLEIDHTTSFLYQNFYVNLRTGFPSGKENLQRLSLQLAGDFGEWLGNCSGENCSLQVPILQEARFEAAGDYYISVEQFSRDNPLGAVNGVGLTVQLTPE